ncbi:hypothetical protein [Amphibacillus indicireducens]|uniref:Phage protein n=1 Tax=Amphibacillus indicireducens TaxID=1076330 RepID=A0ABP7V1R0_9BACI
MSKRKKRKLNTPTRKWMKRATRLHSAKHFITKYEGKNLVKDYSRYYGVDNLCAVRELEMLGYSIEESYIAEMKNELKHKQLKAERKKQQKLEKMQEEVETWVESDGKG